jgi:hypothetical protein
MTIPTSYFSTVRHNSFIVCYWRLNETSGTKANDYAAKFGLNGIYDGATKPFGHEALILNDESAGSAKFGSTGQNIEVPDAVPLRVTENISIEAWIVPVEVNQTSTVFSKMNSAVTFPAPYSLGISSGKIIFSLGNGSSSVSITSPNVIPLGIPSHIFVTLFRKVLYIYINGKQEIAKVLGAQEIKDEKQPIFIGALSNNTKRYNGYSSEIALYKGSLSPKIILKHFNIGRQINLNPYYIKSFDQPTYS